MTIAVVQIKTSEAYPWIMKKHYAKRMPSVSYAFGLYEKTNLVGIVTYGQPASPSLCLGICGEEWRLNVLELNRVSIESNIKNSASILISRSLKLLPKPKIIVSYADTVMDHVGYIYQASNWIYTGATKERTDMASGDGKHSRHHKGDTNNRVIRSSKHRYIYFVGSKTVIKKMSKCLNYKKLPYPKGDVSRYKNNAKIKTQLMMEL